MLAGGGGYALAGRDDLWGVELAGLANTVTEITRAEENAIEAWQRTNFLDVL